MAAARRLGSPLERAADAYLVRRGAGKTIIAGYPWFTDWGRDTFIALRGLCLATGRLTEARDILLEWAGAVSRGHAAQPLPRPAATRPSTTRSTRRCGTWSRCTTTSRAMAARRPTCPQRLGDARATRCEAILAGYAAGTRYGIRVATRTACSRRGEPGVQLTWMDAKVGDWVVTPRIGKPVEIQALWLNALRDRPSGSRRRTRSLLRARRGGFAERFWNDDARLPLRRRRRRPRAGTASTPRFRPNQIFAVGGLPFALLDGERARRVVDDSRARLWTPLGLRSLAPGDRPATGRATRAACASATAPTIRARSGRGCSARSSRPGCECAAARAEARREARTRFLAPLLAHLDEAGLGHVSEIADGEPPHTPRGCPFQAWSVGEVLRLDLDVLRAGPTKRTTRKLAAGAV